jgi:putative pyruvate formate lyase activating enzyme
VYSYGPHHGEEPVISGEKGSGTIFFSSCVMKCVYCQNHIFSQTDKGEELSSDGLSDIMLELQGSKCHNINLVSPTQYLPKVVEALGKAYSRGLNIPIIYNTGGYDSLESIKLLDGIVDIYLPDMRYSKDVMAKKFSFVSEYVKNNREIIKEMFRQVGNINTRENIIKKGLIIRLLVLPNDVSGTNETLEYISRYISTKTAISLMSQYYPAYLASFHSVLSRRLNSKEFSDARSAVEKYGFENGWIQPFDSLFDPRLSGENMDSNI